MNNRQVIKHEANIRKYRVIDSKFEVIEEGRVFTKNLGLKDDYNP